MRAFKGWIIAVAAIGLLAACGPKGGAAGPDAKGEIALGNPNAKVTVTEWASLTCPHCAEFNETVFPQIKAKYIDTGKVRYVFREFLTPPASVAAAGFLVARCAPADKYFSITDAIFHSQADLYNDPRGVLFRIGKGVGLTQDQVTNCIQDEKALAALNERVESASKNDGITGTPAFKFNGKSLDGQTLGGSVYPGGEITMAQLDAALAPLLK